jgi:hypothetical protein
MGKEDSWQPEEAQDDRVPSVLRARTDRQEGLYYLPGGRDDAGGPTEENAGPGVSACWR